MNGPQNIDAYLDELAETLLLSPGGARRVLRECEDHLRDAATSLIAEGTEPAQAERIAIQRFGTPGTVARGFSGEAVPLLRLAHAAFLSLTGVAVVGLVAVGLSGIVALALSGVFGRDFVAGDASGVTYTPARCAEYMEYEPGAGNCTEAAVRHHFGEMVDSRLTAGILGLIGLGVMFAMKGWRRGRSRLPAAFAPTVGASVFGVAALGLVFLSGGSNGQMGASLSGALIAAGVAAVYAVRLKALVYA